MPGGNRTSSRMYGAILLQRFFLVVRVCLPFSPSAVYYLGCRAISGKSRESRGYGICGFLGWPMWFALMTFARPAGLRVRYKSQSGVDRQHFIQLGVYSSQLAKNLEQAWKLGKTYPKMPRTWRWSTVIGTLIWIGLLVNMFYTGVMVMECSNRGCCVDNATTLDSCVATGYPGPK